MTYRAHTDGKCVNPGVIACYGLGQSAQVFPFGYLWLDGPSFKPRAGPNRPTFLAYIWLPRCPSIFLRQE